MNLNRRQLLMLVGSAGGLGLSTLIHRQLLGGRNSSTEPALAVNSPQSDATALPAVNNLLAKQGMTNPPRGDVRLVVISDLNSQYGSTDYEPEVDRAIALIPGWQPDLVLCGGDMVAGQSPTLSRAQIQAMWAGFDKHVAAPLRKAKIPFGFTLGNHDASGALRVDKGFLYAQERNLAAAYWNNPRHAPGLKFVDKAGFPFYYTFEHNGVFFLVWDATTAVIPAQQIAWADRTLASPRAQAAKLRIVIGHLPLYAIAVGRDEPGEYIENADALRSRLERRNVHTYISGHDHAYFPGHVGQLQTLQCGILGSGVRPLLNSNLRPYKTLTVVDINLKAADTTYTTYNASTLKTVDQRTLPRFITSPTAKVLRRDVQMADLLTPEQVSRGEAFGRKISDV